MRVGIIAVASCMAVSIGTPANAAEYVLDVSAKAEQASRFEDGREAVDDATPTSSVRVLEPRQQTPKQSGFRVYVMNNSGKPFNFGPENVIVKLQDGTNVAMLTYQDLMKQQKRREAWQAVAVGFRCSPLTSSILSLTAAHPHRLTPQPRPGNFSLTMPVAEVDAALDEQVLEVSWAQRKPHAEY